MEQKKDKKHYHPVFNKKGKASFFIDQDMIHIYSWDGEPVAFVEKGGVWTFKKDHLGWYEEGWFRDEDGKCVGFIEIALGRGGPNPPKTKHPADQPADKKDMPDQPEIEETPDRPPRKALWSETSAAEFFSGKKSAAKKAGKKK